MTSEVREAAERFSEMWSCFNCNYLGLDYDEDEHGESCPKCGTHSGDGFGMAENDPRYQER